MASAFGTEGQAGRPCGFRLQAEGQAAFRRKSQHKAYVPRGTSADLLKNRQSALERFYQGEGPDPPKGWDKIRGIWTTWTTEKKHQATRFDESLECQQGSRLDPDCPQ